MPAKPKPDPSVRRYVGGLEVRMILPSGRDVTLAPNDLITLLASEVDAIDARPDFVPVTTNPPEEG